MNIFRRSRLSIVLLVAALAVGGFLASCGRQREAAQNDAASARKYCGPDGQLSATQSVQSHRSYCVLVRSLPEPVAPGTPLRLVYSIIDDRGQTLRHFATVHEKQMHLIVVRRDLQEFQHVHPAFNEASGEFTLEGLSFPTVGPYRLFADFTPASAMLGPNGQPLPVTVPFDVEAGDTSRYRGQALPPSADVTVAGAYEVSLSRPDILRSGDSARLVFTVRRDGAPVADLEPYLGANGHAVVLREGDLAFIHSHALEDRIALQAGQLPFMVDFIEPGQYRIFVQFQHKGNVHTAAFTLPTVIRGKDSQSSGGHTSH